MSASFSMTQVRFEVSNGTNIYVISDSMEGDVYISPTPHMRDGQLACMVTCNGRREVSVARAVRHAVRSVRGTLYAMGMTYNMIDYR